MRWVLAPCLALAGCSGDPQPVPMASVKAAMEACAPNGGMRIVARTAGNSYWCGFRRVCYSGGYTATCENDLVINKSNPIPDDRR